MICIWLAPCNACLLCWERVLICSFGREVNPFLPREEADYVWIQQWFQKGLLLVQFDWHPTNFCFPAHEYVNRSTTSPSISFTCVSEVCWKWLRWAGPVKFLVVIISHICKRNWCVPRHSISWVKVSVSLPWKGYKSRIRKEFLAPICKTRVIKFYRSAPTVAWFLVRISLLLLERKLKSRHTANYC